MYFLPIAEFVAFGTHIFIYSASIDLFFVFATGAQIIMFVVLE